MRTFIAVSLVFIACDNQASNQTPGVYSPSGDTIATVNGTEIHQDMVDVILDRIPQVERDRLEASGQLGALTDQLITTELLYQKALENNLQEQQDTQVALAFAARSALAESMIATEVESRITPEAIQAWYDAHLVQFASAQIQMSHLVVSDEATANTVKGQLDAGADFGEMVQEHSIDPRTRDSGGDMGEWVNVDQLLGVAGDAVTNAKAGDLIGPLDIGQAWIIIRVSDTRSQVPIEEAETDIRANLDQELTQAFIEELRAEADIVSGAGLLPQGQLPTADSPPAPVEGSQ